YSGSGVFVNTKPGAPPAKPGPEEASLNFEALDVREVAKVILGDYLKESYTVHPAVTGTVTFRTIRPIPMKDLLPTLEMLLRQNNAAVVHEEGIYKILPITAVRGSVSPQLGGSAVPIPAGFSVLVVPLKYVGAREMAKLLVPIERLNALLVVTTQPRYLEMARNWLERLDQAGGSSAGSKFYVYQVKNGKAENLAQLVGDLFSSRRTTTSAPTLSPGSRPTEL